MSRTRIDETKKKITGARINKQFQRWKNGVKGRSKSSFVKLFDPSISRATLENWLKGEDIPTKYNMEQLCTLFGVPDDYFNIDNATYDELYHYSSVYQTQIGKKHIQFSQMIGLDVDFIRKLSHLVDFDTLFPMYAPINEHMDSGKYDRKVNFADSAHMEEIDEDLGFLQVNQKGKRLTLSRGDLAFLKEVQEKVIDYVEYLFFHRSKEMEEETKKFNLDLTEVTVGGKPVPDSEKEEYITEHDMFRKHKKEKSDTPKEDLAPTKEEIEWYKKRHDEILKSKSTEPEIIITEKGVTPEFIREHDRFARYIYVFPDQPKPDWCSLYEGEAIEDNDPPRKATQGDIDHFLDGNVKLPGGGVGTVKEGE